MHYFYTIYFTLPFRNERAFKINQSIASLNGDKTIDSFDFEFQPSINKIELLDFVTLRFITNKENIVFIGSSGVGKTHLANAIGIEAIKQRVSTYSIPFARLIDNLILAQKENRLEKPLKLYSKYKLLIIDEIGYLPINQQGANVFFQLVNRKYENSSIILTTNQPFSKWGEIFSNNTIANAILDRILHHSHVINITGPSYRLRNLGNIERKEETNQSI
ncbi:MAG TPA: IS21-like element helper ATPase IstB [Haloplasmataceae bacterium]